MRERKGGRDRSISTDRFSISAGFVSARVTVRRRDFHVSSPVPSRPITLLDGRGHLPILLPYARLADLLPEEARDCEIFRANKYGCNLPLSLSLLTFGVSENGW